MSTIFMINTVPRDFLHHMEPYIQSLQSLGNRVILVSSGSPKPLEWLIDVHNDYFDSYIVRKPNLFSDLRALIRIYYLIRRVQPDVVHTISPKAGLIGAIAGSMAGVPIRVHTFTGQVWANKKGASRTMLMMLDKVIGRFCTHTLTDSESQKNFLIDCRVIPKEKINVLGNGSVCGVNTDRFLRDEGIRMSMREELQIGESDTVFLYIGRLNKDKGIHDLLDAFGDLDQKLQKCWLLMVGHCEDDVIRARLDGYKGNLIYREYSPKPEKYYWVADVLCLPSYREGFGNVIIEGASACLPSMASDIYGITDAIENNKSGLLHEPGNIQEIRNCLMYWIDNPDRIKTMGTYARSMAIKKFSMSYLIKEFTEFYKKIGIKIK